MLRLLLLAACAAPAAALPFGFGRRKGEVLASLHEIEADLADLETTNPVPQTVVQNAPPCGPLPAAVAPQVHVVTYKAGLADASPSPAGPAGEPPSPEFCFDFKCGAKPADAEYAEDAAGVEKTAETPCTDAADCTQCFDPAIALPETPDEATALAGFQVDNPREIEVDKVEDDTTGCIPFAEYLSCIQNDACRKKLEDADPLTPRADLHMVEMVAMGVPPNLAMMINGPNQPPTDGTAGGKISALPGFSVNPAADDLPT